jgi:hypothetical protein
MMRGALRTVAVACALLATSHLANAATPPTEDEALFQSAVTRMHEGKPGEAIADFEALADHGVIDATVSFDRGLAYASRVRVGGEQPGDLGEATDGLLEAKRLTNDRELAAEATRAIALIRAEVGRRRVRAGEAVEFDPGTALGPSFLGLLPEDVWALLGLLGSLVLGVALFARRAARERRSQIAATVTAGVATLFLVLGTTSMLAARHRRITVTPGVIVSAGARPTNERGLVVPNAPVIPEAAEVEILGHRAGWARVRWGNVLAWVPSGAVRAVEEGTR